ncbi:MAG: hypothetical protein GX603_04275 [Chloroflexi bacterium]|nr:hypothetical protein [Chloroflexota bacterium]
MKRKPILLLFLILLAATMIAGCGNNKPTEVVSVPISNLATTSWITEPIQASASDLTMEVLHVTQKGNDLVLRVKFPLVDWRNWYISRVVLKVEGGESYLNAQTVFFERIYQKGANIYCLYQPSYNEIERCLESESMETYQIDELIFSDLPEDLEGRVIVLEILELSTQTASGSVKYCEDLRLPYIEETVGADFPGLTVECDASGYRVSIAEAQSAVDALIAEASSGVVVGPWRFEIRK